MLSPPPTAESTASGEENGDHLGKNFKTLNSLHEEKKKRKRPDQDLYQDHLVKDFATFDSLHETKKKKRGEWRPF